MRVRVNGTLVSIDEKDDLIGFGGQGKVYYKKVDGVDLALKVYYEPTPQLAARLKAIIGGKWNVPASKAALAQFLVEDESGNLVLGPAMTYLGKGFEELTSLTKKPYRKAHLIDTRQVVDIYLDGAKTVQEIHANDICIGDFNDMNALFRGTEMLFLDTDAWQFGAFPCPVGAEQFLDPRLYGIDLSLRPVFKPENDWYSFAVLLFKSLLLVHPYGGTHKGHKNIIARATHRVTVFHPDVIYPTIAIGPDMLDDDLAHSFDLIFSKGQRGVFPINQLQDYRDSLIDCPKCKSSYPSSRKQCPVCTEKTIIFSMKPTSVQGGATVIEFVKTNGSIIYSRLVGNKLFVIAYEGDKTVLYTKHGNMAQTRQELFNVVQGAKFEMIGEETLVIAQPDNAQLLLLDISGEQPKPIKKIETSIYAGNRRAMFRTSNQHLFRIIAGNLMYGEVKDGELQERVLRNVMNNATWFAVRQETDGSKPAALGFFQMGTKPIFWLAWDGRHYDDLSVSEMQSGEFLVDVSVKFSSQGAIIRRLTQYQGVNYLRTDVVSVDGKILHSAPRIKEEDHPSRSIHGQAYTTGILLHATDEGVMQEKVDSNGFKTFDSTKGHVSEGDTLYIYTGGSLLAVKDSVVLHIKLS